MLYPSVLPTKTIQDRVGRTRPDGVPTDAQVSGQKQPDGRAYAPCQGGGRGFESRRPLKVKDGFVTRPVPRRVTLMVRGRAPGGRLHPRGSRRWRPPRSSARSAASITHEGRLRSYRSVHQPRVRRVTSDEAAGLGAAQGLRQDAENVGDGLRRQVAREGADPWAFDVCGPEIRKPDAPDLASMAKGLPDK